jgi:hypothetical protein
MKSPDIPGRFNRAVLGLLHLPPILAHAVTDPLRRHLQQIAPMTARLAIQATTNLRALPIAPWAGLGVLTAWAVGAVLIGGLLLRLQEAWEALLQAAVLLIYRSRSRNPSTRLVIPTPCSTKRSRSAALYPPEASMACSTIPAHSSDG